MKNQEPTKPTGNLEELFRHHLAEAAVPPASRVWEQVDNTLLLAENETYRRRLRATRWLAAASLLLAALAGIGWWNHRDFQPTQVAATANRPADLAAARDRQPVATTKSGAATPGLSAARGVGNQPAGNAAPAAAATTPALTTNSPLATGQSRRLSPNQAERRAPLAARQANGVARQSAARPMSVSIEEANHTNPDKQLTGAVDQTLAARAAIVPTSRLKSGSASSKPGQVGRPAIAATAVGGTAPGRVTAPVGPAARDAEPTAGMPPSLSAFTSAASPSAIESTEQELQRLLSGGLVNLAPTASLPLPTPLPLLPMPTSENSAELARRWRLGVGYTAGLFQANVNFSRGGVADVRPPYNPALGDNSPALSEAAAAEYRAQQRSGLSQRLRLQASRRLRGHWSLETGLEVAQLESRSATSYTFTGEQVPDLSQSLDGGPRQATTARYRTAGLPLELRYANSIKTGFSLYSRVGAVVSALLTSRTEVEGNPEATRTYNLLSTSTPYRRVLGTVRGAAGVQFRPAGHDYTLSLGPVAEGGLWSLNARPAQDFLSQSRPYSFGLEAGVEFGRSVKPSKPAESL